MVVNRKKPVVPVPPISRTASSQPLPSKRQTRISNAVSGTQEHQKSNGLRPTPPQPQRRVKSSKSEKKRKSKTFVDYLILFVLSAFTCYSFYVCGPNPPFSPSYEPQPSLCRALATYHTHVLEPYVLPPIKQTLHYVHQVSGPYVEEARVHLSPYFEPAKTVINTWTPHAKSLIHTTSNVWKNTIVPLYTQTLRPYYDTAVVPRYTRYIKPLLVPLQNKIQTLVAYYVSNPVRSRASFALHQLHQFYTLHVDPYVRIARPYIHRISTTTRAVGIKLSTLFTTYLHPSLLKIWDTGRSAVCTTLKHFFRLFFQLADGIYTCLKWITKEVGSYRRQYVDRHVTRILEQVAEPKVNGNANEADKTSFLVSERGIVSESLLPAFPPQETATLEREPSDSPLVTAISTAPSSQLESSASMPKVDATSNSGSAAEAEVVGVVQKSADHASIVMHQPENDSDILVGYSTSTSTSTPLNPPSASTNGVSPITEPAVTAESTLTATPELDADLDDFLRELGVGEQANPVPTPDDANEIFDDVVASVRPKTEEERLVETAAKRADIVGRHEKWFERLHAGVKETGGGLVKTLQSLRDDAAEEVSRLGTRSLKANSNRMDEEPVKDARSLKRVEEEGEKLIKGLDGYLRKAESRCNDWKMPTDAPDNEMKRLKHDITSKEKEKFSDIVAKVEGKFFNRVDTTRLEVHNWYMDLKEREANEVLRASAVIKNIATHAQEDLAMDYAWLDDVTYLDWQKYHDLMRVYDSFDVVVRQIANGTSTDPTPPSDPVLETLDELDRNLQDIVLGFNYAVSGMRSRGLTVFDLRPLDDEGGNYDSEGFFVVKDNERRIVDLRDIDLGQVELKKEAVSVLPIINQDGNDVKESEDSIGILPVPDVQLPENGESRFDASIIVIGKDKMQIEESLRDIPLEPAQRHTEL